MHECSLPGRGFGAEQNWYDRNDLSGILDRIFESFRARLGGGGEKKQRSTNGVCIKVSSNAADSSTESRLSSTMYLLWPCSLSYIVIRFFPYECLVLLPKTEDVAYMAQSWTQGHNHLKYAAFGCVLLWLYIVT